MKALGAMHAESYLGVPIHSTEGKVLGHLFIIDDTPMADPARMELVLLLMARRASVELQRSTAAPVSAAAEKEEEVELDDAYARMRSAIEGLPFPVVMTDENGIITLVNGKLEELSGRKPDDLLHRRAWPLILRGGPWQLLKEEYPDTVERPDRSAIQVSVFAIPCRNREGRISGTMGILTQRGEAHPLDPQ
jgi:PAS domain S-box-containing protein